LKLFPTPVQGLGENNTHQKKLINIALNKATRASNSYKHEKRPALAVDGVEGNGWISGGFSPQWIEIDLQSLYDLYTFELIVDQNPPGLTWHEIYGRASPEDEWLLLSTIKKHTEATQQLLVKSGAEPYKRIRFVRIITKKSPSWVAWLEIKVFARAYSQSLKRNQAYHSVPSKIELSNPGVQR